MARRVCVAALVLAAVSAVFVAPGRAYAQPRVATTALPPAHPAKVSAQSVTSAAYPYADTFRLHSLPGAQRVVYLDFDGDTLSGTAWNDQYNGGAPVVAPAYDFDGSAASFSNGELDVIQAVWQRVAEDYAPFAIDVTTEDPGAAAIDRSGTGDLVFGTRALISDTTFIYNGCGCAGVAYIDVFDAPAPYHQYYQPALVFGKALGPYDKDLADAVSHEVGHNLGLEHDGKNADDYYTGQGAWAPIMGAGYYRPITQWNKGDYTGATNTQDDLAVMQQAGAPLRADDHGDTLVGATPLLVGTAAGVITTDADVDVFSVVTTGGAVNVHADPAPKGPNLDVKLELLDILGNVLAADDPPSSQPSTQNPDYATGLDASIATTLGAGTYFVRVQGVGAGDPATTGYSGYGSVGRYTLSVSAPHLASLPTLSISDATAYEGASGLTPVNFTLSLSAPSAFPVTVVATSVDGTAKSTGVLDFVKTLGALVTIPAGQTSATLQTNAYGDTTPEPHEKFSVVLASPVGATIADGTGIATVKNDDGIGISIDNVTKYEGAAGTYNTYAFTVSLSMIPSWPVSVTASTFNWTAVAPADYFAKTRVLSFAAGERTKTFVVVLRGDAVREEGEKFFVTLTNPTAGATVLTPYGTGLIRNDDF